MSLCVSWTIAQATDAPASPAPGLAKASDSKLVLSPGLSAAPDVSSPTAAKQALYSSAKDQAMASATSQVADPMPKKRSKVKTQAPERPKKWKELKRDKEKEKAQEGAFHGVVIQRVDQMREERSKEMPYLDKIFIRTAITPLKSQQKDEFLKGGPKDLEDLLIRAQSIHMQAKAAHENIALYNRKMLVAFRKLFPEATLDVNDRVGTLSSLPYTGGDWHVTLRQPIFKGGVLWNTFLQERAMLESAKKNYDKTIAELIYDLSKAYYEYQRAQQSVEEYRAMVERMKRFADMSEEKFKEKIISEMEHLNVQSIYSQMKFDLEDANQEFEIAKLEMQKYLDLEVDDTLTVEKLYDLDSVAQQQAAPTADPANPKKVPDVFKGEAKSPELPKLIDLSYGHRPELQVEAAKLQAARLGERVKWGEFLPQAYLTYKFGGFGEAYTQDGQRQHFGQDNPGYDTNPAMKKEWQIMLEMNWNLGGNKASYTFDNDHKAPSITTFEGASGTKTRKNGLSFGVLDGLDAFVSVKQAEVEKLNQVVELEKAEKLVLKDVKEAYYSYQKAMIQVNSTVKRLEYRKRLRDYTEYRLGKKEVELPEYMQAEADLVKEKAELHRALKDYFTAKAALNHAVGIQDLLNAGASGKK